MHDARQPDKLWGMERDMHEPVPAQPLRFVRRGRWQRLPAVPVDRTLLALLREDLADPSVKEGCASGDCGACTVVVAEAVGGRIVHRVINSCIRPAHAIDGLALWTAADLVRPDGRLHPVQQALVDRHGSQCGFCTPGFVMSLYALWREHRASGRPVTRADAEHALSGNLCRCTGYRPILDAARHMMELPAPADDEDAASHRLLLNPEHSIHDHQGLEADSAYFRPTSAAAALALRTQHPDARVVAGCTDAGLWLTQQLQRWPRVLDLSRVAEWRHIAEHDGWQRVGAAVSLQAFFDHLAARWPQLAEFGARFAGRPVREAGTVGGNVANGSPIGDSMPLLIALGAQVVLASAARGERRLPLEDFYTGYRRTQIAPDELLAAVEWPSDAAAPGDGAGRGLLRAEKLSKRREDDISAVCLALNLRFDAANRVAAARIGAGGVAAVPARARRTEAALLGQPWAEATVRAAMQTIAAEFSPIDDLRASAAYRRAMLAALLWRAWQEQPGVPTAPAASRPPQRLEHLEPLP